jgi:hypothetical protein
MLRLAYFYRKGALRSFAAPSTKVTNADFPDLGCNSANDRFRESSQNGPLSTVRTKILVGEMTQNAIRKSREALIACDFHVGDPWVFRLKQSGLTSQTKSVRFDL